MTSSWSITTVAPVLGGARPVGTPRALASGSPELSTDRALTALEDRYADWMADARRELEDDER